MRGILQDENLQMFYVYSTKFASDERRMIFSDGKKKPDGEQTELDFSKLLDQEIHELSPVI